MKFTKYVILISLNRSCEYMIFWKCRVLETFFTHHKRCTGCPINSIKKTILMCPTNYCIFLPYPLPYKLGIISWWNTLYLIPFMKKDELLTSAIEFLYARLHSSIFTFCERKSATIWQEYRTQGCTEFSCLEGGAGFWLLPKLGGVITKKFRWDKANRWAQG